MIWLRAANIGTVKLIRYKTQHSLSVMIIYAKLYYEIAAFIRISACNFVMALSQIILGHQVWIQRQICHLPF